MTDLPTDGVVLEGWGEPKPKIADPTMGMRVYAVARWAADLAITEMRDGTEHALILRDAGPEQYLPTEDDWARINDTAKMGVNYVLTGSTDIEPPKDYAEVFQGDDGKFYYRVKAANHEIVDGSQGYATHSNATRALRRNHPDVEVRE